RPVSSGRDRAGPDGAWQRPSEGSGRAAFGCRSSSALMRPAPGGGHEPTASIQAYRGRRPHRRREDQPGPPAGRKPEGGAASLKAELLLERAEENPFLPRFYQDPRQAALPAQLFFLLQRVEELRRLRQADLFRPCLVADYLFEKDRLFAELNLDEHEFALYDKLYRQLAPEVPPPDLVIYLQAPVDVFQR